MSCSWEKKGMLKGMKYRNLDMVLKFLAKFFDQCTLSMEKLRWHESTRLYLANADNEDM